MRGITLTISYLAPMRRWPLLLFLSLVPTCGGGAGEGAAARSAKTATAGTDDSDRGFSEYAATHGITSLDHPDEAPEVTADGLRLEALDRSKPVKLDGVLNEWPAAAKATLAARGATKATLAIALQYDDARLYVGADVT